jgi:hypothetical protein
MNFFKNIFTNSNSKAYTILTGGQLKYSKDILIKLDNPSKKYLVLHKDYQDSLYDDSSNVRVFNCDLSQHQDLEELLHYLKDHRVNRP